MWKDWIKAGLVLGTVTWYVSPRRNAANLISTMGETMNITIRTALGTEGIRQTEAPKPFTGLTKSDEDWLYTNGWTGEFPR